MASYAGYIFAIMYDKSNNSVSSYRTVAGSGSWLKVQSTSLFGTMTSWTPTVMVGTMAVCLGYVDTGSGYTPMVISTSITGGGGGSVSVGSYVSITNFTGIAAANGKIYFSGTDSANNFLTYSDDLVNPSVLEASIPPILYAPVGFLAASTNDVYLVLDTTTSDLVVSIHKLQLPTSGVSASISTDGVVTHKYSSGASLPVHANISTAARHDASSSAALAISATTTGSGSLLFHSASALAVAASVSTEGRVNTYSGSELQASVQQDIASGVSHYGSGALNATYTATAEGAKGRSSDSTVAASVDISAAGFRGALSYVVTVFSSDISYGGEVEKFSAASLGVTFHIYPSVRIDHFAASPLSITSSISGNGSVSSQRSASPISAIAHISSTGQAQYGAGCSIGVTADISAAGHRDARQPSAPISVYASTTANSYVPRSSDASVVGTATINAAINLGGVSGSALSASSHIDVAGVRSAYSSALVSLEADISSLGSTGKASDVTPLGLTSATDTSGVVGHYSECALAVDTAISSNGYRNTSSGAALAISTDIHAGASLGAAKGASLTVFGSVSSNGLRSTGSDSGLVISVDLPCAGVPNHTGSSGVSVYATTSVVGSYGARSSTALAISSSLDLSLATDHIGSVSLPVSADIASAGAIAHFGWSALSTAAAMEITGEGNKQGSGLSLLNANAVIDVDGDLHAVGGSHVDVTSGISSSGRRGRSTSVSSAVSISMTTDGAVTHNLGSGASLAIAVSIGVVPSLNNVGHTALPVAASITGSGVRESYSSVGMAISFAITTSGRYGASQAASLSATLSMEVAGIRDARTGSHLTTEALTQLDCLVGHTLTGSALLGAVASISTFQVTRLLSSSSAALTAHIQSGGGRVATGSAAIAIYSATTLSSLVSKTSSATLHISLTLSHSEVVLKMSDASLQVQSDTLAGCQYGAIGRSSLKAVVDTTATSRMTLISSCGFGVIANIIFDGNAAPPHPFVTDPKVLIEPSSGLVSQDRPALEVIVGANLCALTVRTTDTDVLVMNASAVSALNGASSSVATLPNAGMASTSGNTIGVESGGSQGQSSVRGSGVSIDPEEPNLSMLVLT